MLTPLPSREKAGEVQALFWGLPGGMPFPLQWGWGRGMPDSSAMGCGL